MKKLILSVFVLLALLVIVTPAFAEIDSNKRLTDGEYEYEVKREGNNITIISTVPKLPRVAGIPNLVGTITGTTFTGEAYLVADECPNLDGYVPASGTVTPDGSSVTVTYNTSDFYYTTCMEKANSESEVTKTYSIASALNTSPTPFFTIQPTRPEETLLDYGISDILGFNRELLQFEEIQKKIDKCPPPRVPSESGCVRDALSQFDLPGYLIDVVIEPDFTNTIVLDESKVQIVSFPEGTKEAPDYMLNTISANSDYLKEEIIVDKSQLPIINLSPAYPAKVHMPDQSFSIVKSDGLSSVLVPDVTKPVLNYPGNWESVSNLVSLDNDEISRNVINIPTATKLLLDSNAKVTLLDRGNQNVMEISKGAAVLVAGWAANDTLEAARDFVSQLSR